MVRAKVEQLQVHLYLVQFEEPIAALAAVGGLGALAGIVNLAATLTGHKK